METLLYTAELIQDGGTYKLVVQDLVRDTVQTTPIPRAAVDRLPAFLSTLGAKLSSSLPRARR
ncbi:hypothetical protein [Kitasatospora sp. GP82]|uniref:hypothetical protein n=1 Tax=Kitasatospora sp. GP82 TaxID=3035089 RepID=UPI002475EAFB|nr:hypothetical protein [Kitasatospora sp. GP82]MDH6127504.1 hypothetical protein [Kitasatospora sp. GP82]